MNTTKQDGTPMYIPLMTEEDETAFRVAMSASPILYKHLSRDLPRTSVTAIDDYEIHAIDVLDRHATVQRKYYTEGYSDLSLDQWNGIDEIESRQHWEDSKVIESALESVFDYEEVEK